MFTLKYCTHRLSGNNPSFPTLIPLARLFSSFRYNYNNDDNCYIVLYKTRNEHNENSYKRVRYIFKKIIISF